MCLYDYTQLAAGNLSLAYGDVNLSVMSMIV